MKKQQMALQKAIRTGDFSRVKVKGFPDVYYRDYWARVLDSMEEDFPRVKRALKSKFEGKVRDYLQKYPSKNWTLAALGKEFPAFLPAGKLRDLARLDWAEVLAYLAPDTFQEGSLVSLHRSVQIIYLSGQSKIIWRSRGVVMERKLSSLDEAIFARVCKGTNLTGLVEFWVKRRSSPKVAQGWFYKWAKRGVLGASNTGL